MTPQEESVPSHVCICGDQNCKIKFGFCHCGCGNQTTISKSNNTGFGYVKGNPRKWVSGHQNRIHPSIEEAYPFKIDGFYCRIIPLTLGVFSIVLADHYKWLMQWKWYAQKDEKNGSFYAVRNSPYYLGRRERIFMHRQIMERVSTCLPEWDHIDGNTLLNIPSNLRPVSYTQNCINQKIRKDNTSGRKGVHQRKDNGKFRVILSFEGESIRFGQYDTLQKASVVRDLAEMKYHGEYRRAV